MAWFSQKAFQRLGDLMTRSARSSQATFGPLVTRLTPIDEKDHLDWAGDADWARLQQEPLRARQLLRLAALALLVMLVWAAFASIDEVTRGEARVVPTSQLQIVQSVDGGVVTELLVKEGQTVEAGQLLLKIDPTRFVSSMLESRSAQLAMQAKVLRLQALTRGTAFIPPPELTREVPDVVAQETRLYESRRAEINAQISIAQNQLGQRQQELNEVRARREQAERGLELMTKELNATRPMIASGAVSEVEVFRLEREVARLRGDREQATAQIARVQSAILEATRKIEEVQLTSRNQMSAELSETMSKLASVSQSGLALEDKVATKLMANSDRWADDSVMCRDIIDLAMLAPTGLLDPIGIDKALRAYGPSVINDLDKARTHLLEREGGLALCMRKMGMTMPIDLLRDRIQALSVKPLGDDKGRKKSPRV